MNNILLLTKLSLKLGSGLQGNAVIKNGKRPNRKAQIALFAIIGIALLYKLTQSILFGMTPIYNSLAAMGKQDSIISMVITVANVYIFVFSIPSMMATYYLSTDLENLLPLPIKPYEIITSKFISALVMQYVLEVILVLPVLLGFGMTTHGGVVYYFIALIVFIMLPVFPMSIALIINLIIMSFTSLSKNKEFFKGLVTMVILGLSFGMRFIMKYLPSSSSNVSNIATADKNPMFSYTDKLFFHSKYMKDALVNSNSAKGYINLLIFLAIIIALYIVASLIAQKLYFRGVLGMNVSNSKKRVLTNNEFAKGTKQNSLTKTFLQKEFNTLFKTSAFLVYGIVRSWIIPVFIIVAIFAKGDVISMIGQAFSMDTTGKIASIGIIIAFAFVVLMNSLSNITNSTINREGKNAFILKYIPVEYSTQIMIKSLSSVIINIPFVIVAVILALVLKMPILTAIYAFVLGILGLVFSSLTGTIINLMRPNIEWDNEIVAVRIGINSLINLILNAICGSFLWFLVKMTITPLGTFAVIAVVYIIFILITTTYIKKSAHRLFKNIG